MEIPRIGVALSEPTARDLLSRIQRAEELGVKAVWLTTGLGTDALTIFAGAAATTQRVMMGTAIVPTFPRHPLVMAQQAADIASIAPGRFALGIGPSHAPGMTGRYGIPYAKPLEHLREYVAVLRAALNDGNVDFTGERYSVHAATVKAAVPIIISALRAQSYSLAGEIADGAVAWICPAPYLRDVARPAMERGAVQAGRSAPPMIAHAFLCVSEDREAMLQAVPSVLGRYPTTPNYQAMFEAAGYPEAGEGKWSAAMLEAVVLQGDEAAVSRKIEAFMATSGAQALILSIMPAGPDRIAATERALRCVTAMG